MTGSCRCLLAAFFLCSCGTQTRVDLQNRETSYIGQTYATRPPIDELAERANRIALEIGELRGWDGKLDVSFELADRHRIIDAMLTDERSQMEPSVRQAQAEFLKSLGWVPIDFDFERDITQAFSQELLGLYCFTWRRVLLTAGPSHAAIESTLRHELVHAFQDKYFHIGDKVRWQQDQGDRIAAIHALAEGEAICITRQLEDPQHRGCLDSLGSDFENHMADRESGLLPAIIRYSLFSPYVDGIQYVQQLLRLGGWPRVEEAWRGNLSATRDVIHASQPSASRAVEIPASMPHFGECQPPYVDVVGEQGLAGVFFDHLRPSAAKTLASKLEADRVAYWRCDDSCGAAWHLSLASDDAAAEAAKTIRTLLMSGTSASPKGAAACKTSSIGAVRLVRRSRDIVITSVHGCDSGISLETTISCNAALRWADRLIAQ